LHTAKVAGATTDIDEERVGDRIDIAGLADTCIVAKAEGGEEWFGNEQDAVKDTKRALASALAGMPMTMRISAWPEGSMSERARWKRSRAAAG
jgi:hypothetical protein